jgi:serine/threonine-protein kinase
MKKPLLVTGLALAGLALACLALSAGRSSAQKDDLSAKAEDILKKRCAECHSPKAKKLKGDLDLWNPAHLADKDRDVVVLVPGDPEKSGMIQRLRAKEASQLMPPKKNGGPLGDDEVKVLTAWVKAGGKYPGGTKLTTRAGGDKEKSGDKEPPPPPPPPLTEEAKLELAGKARELLSTYCYRCHGVENQGGKLDVMKIKVMVETVRSKKKAPYVTPGNSEKSDVYLRMGKDMPPDGEVPYPGEAERAVIKQWIDAGAPDFSKINARKFVSIKDQIVTMRDYLKRAPSEDRPYIKFFTMTHLHNDPTVTSSLIRQSNAALSKVINHLSWKARIVVPQAIDREKTIFVVDIRDLDWDRKRNGVNLWRAILVAYPYGLRYDEDENDDELAQADKDLYGYAGKVVPYVRGDWFVATAARPPLYHTLLQLPTNAVELEKYLDVDIPENFSRNKLARAGFVKSGVSGQNRLLDRHEAKYGSFWKSYDFKEHKGDNAADREKALRSNIFTYPLGPVFRRPYDEFNRQAFLQDGGEIIWTLPNGLQGYFLVDGKDNRIDEGPLEVVSDSKKTSGTNAIVNGLSCMYCHRHGPIRFSDELRETSGVSGAARRKLRFLAPEQKRMEQLLQDDEERFMGSLSRAIGPFLRVGKDESTPVEKLTGEPVGELARRFKLVPLNSDTVAAELGIEKGSEIETLVKVSPELRELGLGPLMRAGGAIKRFEWENIPIATSVYQRVALRLRKGTPYRVVR